MSLTQRLRDGLDSLTERVVAAAGRSLERRAVQAGFNRAAGDSPERGAALMAQARMDAAQAQAQADLERMDACGGGGGCGDFGGNRNPSPRELLLLQPGMSRETIDWFCIDQLMWRVVVKLAEDACAVRPEMVSGILGDLDPVADWLGERHYWEEEEMAIVFSRQYGGGGVLCAVDDGQPADRPVDLARVRDVIGFLALPRHYLVPDGVPGSSMRAAWWGQQVGRPRAYYVNPQTWGGDVTVPDDLQEYLSRSGQKFHASRVVPFHYRRHMDWRQRRLHPNWRGWGPGVVEAVAAAFETRRFGMLRVADFLNSVGYDHLQISGVVDAKSTPRGGANLWQQLDNLKRCIAYTQGDGIPMVATGPESKITPLTRSAASLDKLVFEMRRYFLDVCEYPEVVLYGTTNAGLGSGRAEGEWQAYFKVVDTFNERARWPGTRQAAVLAMAAKAGPTGGRIDLKIEASWPSQWVESDAERSKSRLADAQSRAIEVTTLGLDGEQVRRLDPTVERYYPGLQAELDAQAAARLAAGAPSQAPGSPPALSLVQGGAATTPSASGTATEPTEDAAPKTLPRDLLTEPEARQILRAGRRTFRRLVERGTLTAYQTAMGIRFSEAQIVAAVTQRPPVAPTAPPTSATTAPHAVTPAAPLAQGG